MDDNNDNDDPEEGENDPNEIWTGSITEKPDVKIDRVLQRLNPVSRWDRYDCIGCLTTVGLLMIVVIVLIIAFLPKVH